MFYVLEAEAAGLVYIPSLYSTEWGCRGGPAVQTTQSSEALPARDRNDSQTRTLASRRTWGVLCPGEGHLSVLLGHSVCAQAVLSSKAGLPPSAGLHLLMAAWLHVGRGAPARDPLLSKRKSPLCSLT